VSEKQQLRNSEVFIIVAERHFEQFSAVKCLADQNGQLIDGGVLRE
jgi:hypothetical protein